MLECRTLLTAPTVAAIELVDPAVSNSDALSWTVSFSEPVAGVDPTDFVVHSTGTIQAENLIVTGGDSVFTVTMTGITGDGTIRLDLGDDNSIANLAGEALGGDEIGDGDFGGATATIDHTSPLIESILRSSPSTPSTDLSSVTFTVTYSEPVTGVDQSDFVQAWTGSVAAQQMIVEEAGPGVYTVTINGITGIGSVGITPVNDSSIHDLAGNLLTSRNANASFTDQHVLVTQSYPSSVISGDVNGDGLPDLVATNSGTDTVGIQLGNGDGTFEPEQTFATGAGPWSVALGDLNGDGLIDLAVANVFDNTISVLLGNGDGSFQTPLSFSTEFSPFALAISDFNGDGILDLAVGHNTFGGTVSILLGYGDGTFADQQPYSVGNLPDSIATGDINGDGIIDIITANEFDNTVSILFGNGDGSFQDQQTLATGGGPHSATLVDLNADGFLDIVVANSFEWSVNIFYGNGDGTFQDRRTISTMFIPYALTTGDLNGDGSIDIILANDSSSNLSIFLGDSTGSFTGPLTFAAGYGVRSVQVADLNGDGNADLIVGNFYESSIGVLMGNESFVRQVYTIIPTDTVDDEPVLENSNALSYSEGQGAVVVNPLIKVSDSDHTLLKSATIKISGNYVATEDLLGFVPDPVTTGSIVGSFDQSSGTLTLTASGEGASLSFFQAALRKVTYRNTSSNPSTAVRSVDFQVEDGILSSSLLKNQVNIQPVNNSPVLTTAKSVRYNEQLPPVTINAVVTLTDSDNATLAYATASITTNYAPDQDVLGFTGDSTTGDIIGKFNVSTGVLTLISPSASATIAQFEAAFRRVTYYNSSYTPSSLNRSVVFAASDGNKTSNLLTNVVTLGALNTPPELTGTSAIIYKENQSATVVNTTITLKDVDNATMDSAKVRISSAYVADQDFLQFTGDSSITGNITGSFDSVTGTLTLTSAGATATMAQFQAALRLVKYFNTSSNPSLTARTVTFQVSDGNQSSVVTSSLVTIVASNQAAEISAVSDLVFTEGSVPTPVSPLATVSDVDNARVALIIVRISANFNTSQDVLAFTGDSTTGNIVASLNPSSGALTLVSPNGTATVAQFQAALRLVTYQNTSTAPSLATRTISYQVNDRTVLSTAVTSSITIAPVDTAPTLGGAGILHYRKGQVPTAISTSINVGDVDNTSLSTATVQITENYMPGEDVLGFVANPATMGNITGHFDSSTGTLTLTSQNATATLSQFQLALRAVTYFNSSSNPTMPPRSVTYQIFDGSLSSSQVTSVVSIKTTGSVPELAGSSVLSYREAQAASVINPGVTLTDADNASMVGAYVKISANYSSNQDVLSFVGDSTTGNIFGQYNPSSGILTLISPGGLATTAQFQAALRLVTYFNTSSTPSTLTRSVTYQVSDGTNVSSLLTSTINVTSVASAPTLSGINSTIVKEAQAPVAVNSTIVVKNVDQATLSYATIRISGNYLPGEDLLGFVANPATMGNITGSFDPVTGTMTLVSADASATVTQFQTAIRLVTYQNTSPNPSTATRSISYQVSDGRLVSKTLIGVLTIIPTNSAPVLSGTSTAAFTEKQAPVVVNPAIAITDLDSSMIAFATVRLSGNYSSAQDVLTFTPDSTTGSIFGTFNPSTGYLTLISPKGLATVAQFQAALQRVSYYNTSATPSVQNRSVIFQVSDGIALSNSVTSTITVSKVKDAPSLANSSIVSYAENQSATVINPLIAVSGIDQTTLSSATVRIVANYVPGQDVLSFSGNSTTGNIISSFDPLTGVLTLTSPNSTATLLQFQTALRKVTYLNTSVAPSSLNRTISMQVFEGTLASENVLSVISVAPVNDPPAISGTSATTYGEDEPGVIVNSAIVLDDTDSPTLNWARVKISGNYVAGQDVLSFTGGSTTGDLFGSFNATTGILYLISPSATATAEQFQAALRLVTYRNTSANPLTTQRTITFEVSDGQLLSGSVVSTVSVFAVDNPPVLTGLNAVIVSQSDSPVRVNPSVVLQDVDSPTLLSATVRISDNYVMGEDVLAFDATESRRGNIVASFDAATGTLTLTSDGVPATVAQFQAALRRVTYINTSQTPSTLARSIEFSVSNGNVSSNTVTSLITVKTQEAAPTLNNVFNQAYAEDQPPIPVNPLVQVADSDSTTLASATVKISFNYQNNEDVLNFISDGTTGNILGEFNSSTGILTLISPGATATLAQFESALRRVTYFNTSENPTMVTRSITFQVSDGSNVSPIVTSSVSLQ